MEIKLPKYFGEVMENIIMLSCFNNVELCANVLVAQNKPCSHHFQYHIPNVSGISISRYCILDIQCERLGSAKVITS